MSDKNSSTEISKRVPRTPNYEYLNGVLKFTIIEGNQYEVFYIAKATLKSYASAWYAELMLRGTAQVTLQDVSMDTFGAFDDWLLKCDDQVPTQDNAPTHLDAMSLIELYIFATKNDIQDLSHLTFRTLKESIVDIIDHNDCYDTIFGNTANREGCFLGKEELSYLYSHITNPDILCYMLAMSVYAQDVPLPTLFSYPEEFIQHVRNILPALGAIDQAKSIATNVLERIRELSPETTNVVGV